MKTSPSVAIVILNWNGKSLFDRFLPSVLTTSREEGAEVCMADNGSTDGSVEYISKNYPSVRLIRLDRNYGFAGGYNRALRQVDADIYVLLNSDVETAPGWLPPCIRRFTEEPLTAAVQPKILNYSARNRFEYAGAAGGYLDRWGYPFCRGRILNVVEEDEAQYDQPASLFWATGACMFIRSGIFHEAGGFDEDFFAHMEEIDLCWRLKNTGWSIRFEPESRVYHMGGATLSYQSHRKVFLNFRNSLWMLVKNLPEGKLLWVLLPRMVLDGIAAVSFLISGQFFAFKAVFKAHLEFYSTLSKFIAKRKKLLPLVREKNHPEIYRGSMVFNFYFKKRRKFSEYGIINT